MNDTIKELIEEFPELKEDSDKLEKVVKYLENTKPNIEASMEFKDSLRKRLDNIIQIKEGKKNRLWYFALPALSFCLVLSLIFVYYKDITQVDIPLEEGKNSIESISDEITPVMFGSETTGTETGGIMNSKILDEDGSTDTTNSEENISITEDLNIASINALIGETDNMLLDTPLVPTSNVILPDTKIGNEVNDVMNLLDDLFKGIDKIEDSDVIDVKSNEIQVSDEQQEKKSVPESLPTTDTSEMGVGEMFFGVYSFKEYCDYKKGFVVNTGNGKTCRKRDSTECLEINFTGISCEFVPINK